MFAAYADAGQGLAFLLLLCLSTGGLALLGFRLMRSTQRPHWSAAALGIGLLQAWPLFLSIRTGALQISRGATEWLWLTSLLLAVFSLTILLWERRKPAMSNDE